MLKLLEVLMKKLAVIICCYLHTLFARFKRKIYLKFFSKNCPKTGNMRTGTEIVNPCIK